MEKAGLNVREAARYVGVSAPTMLKKILPEIEHRKVGKRLIIPVVNLDKWLLQEEK